MMDKKSVYLCLFVVLLLSACAPSLDQTEEPVPQEPTVQSSPTETASIDVQPEVTALPSTLAPESTQIASLELSSDLVRGCDRNDGTDPELGKGDMAVEFSLMDVDGNSLAISDMLKEKPVALIYGSYT
jgi:hypothetical protein